MTAEPPKPARPCDYCGHSTAVLYCRADSAKLCFSCDREVHSTNQLFSKHTRTLLCDACDDSPATILCSTDTSVLCQNCDWEKHNPALSDSLHQRRPLEGFTGCPSVSELLSVVGFGDLSKKSLLSSPQGSAADGFLGCEIEGLSDLFVWDAPSIVTIDDLICSSASSHSFQAMEVPPLPKNRKAACGRHREEILSQLRELAKSEPLDPEQSVQPGNLSSAFERDVEADIIPYHEWHRESVEPMYQVVPPDPSLRTYTEEILVKQSTYVGETHTFVDKGGNLSISLNSETLPTTPKAAACELTSQERDSALLRYKQKKKTTNAISLQRKNPFRALSSQMTQPSAPPPPPPPLAPPTPTTPPPPQQSESVRVRCAGCRMILTVAPGLTEFACPTCRMPQMLPPELMPRDRAAAANAPTPAPPTSAPPSQPPHAPAHGIDPTKIQLPCASCKAILNVPHGLARFACPQCNVDLAVDVSKVKQFFPAAPPLEEVNEVAVEVERDEDEGGMVGETFTDYRPPKVSIGPPHPDPVVETSSLSAVQPPEPIYDPKIKDDLESSKTLSCLQIETLVYACQRHLQHLPNGVRAGFFIGDGAGVGKGRTIAGLIWENWHHGRRKALWISVGSDLKFDARRDLDDVGATCIEVHALNKLPYSKLDSKSVGIREGVVFLTYNSLIASSEKGRTRLQQLVQWCGPGFDGLVIFDECHKAKNLVPEAGSQPTRTGEAVLDIQDRLPEGRIVYCSATGASEPRNLGYMVRLGLWGDGTSFLDFREFLGALDRGGVGALELVAMDMKARGMYLCRTLSYEGAEFEVIEAPLEEKMMEIYKKAAEFWAELRVELLSASAFLNDKPNSSQLWRLYWASHQRFFRHLCMSAKVPAALRLAKQALVQDKCVVIGLQSTGEARTEEAVTKYGSELDDFVSGPRELLLKFVEENYPLPEKPELLPGEDGVKELQRKRHSATPGVSVKGRVRKVAKWQPPSDAESDEESETDSGVESTDSDDEFQICEICTTEEEKKKMLQCSCCGKLVHSTCLMPPIGDVVPEEWSCHLCKEKTDEYLLARQAYIAELQKRYDAALERKTKISEIIRSLDLPNNPLDDIVDQLGGPDKVAEMTGRRGMLVRAATGKGVTYQARNTKDVTMEMVNMHEKQLFMDGKKSVAIISEAGSAGVSLQADRRAANQKRRVHLTLELPWSADRAIQQFGRTHRSNQASAPEYRILFTNLGGERRFASIVAKRLESLGALTQGDRRAGPSLSAYNYDSAYGKRALMIMYKGIMEQDSLPVVPPGCSSDKPDTIHDFIVQAKAALVSVGIVRDTVLGNGKDLGRLSGRIIDSDMHEVGRFLNRILGLPPDIQNGLFELFVSILDLLVRNARIEGNLDAGIVDLKANVIELQGTPKTVHVDQLTGASTVLFTFVLDRGITWELASMMLNEKQKDGLGSANDGFYESKREWLGKRHFILAFESSASGTYKIVRPPVGESNREMPLSELKSKYRKISTLEKAQSGWEEEYEVSSKQCMHGPNCKIGNFCTVGRRLQEVNVLGGLILPVWGAVEKALSKQARLSHRRLRVVRIETTVDTQRIVGLLVPNAAVETVLQGLAWVQEIDD